MFAKDEIRIPANQFRERRLPTFVDRFVPRDVNAKQNSKNPIRCANLYPLSRELRFWPRPAGDAIFAVEKLKGLGMLTMFLRTVAVELIPQIIICQPTRSVIIIAGTIQRKSFSTS